MRNVSRFGRRVGLGLSWTVAASRLLLATASVATARPSAPAPVAEPDRPAIEPAPPTPRPTLAPDPPPPPASVDPWRSDLQSITWMLVGATVVFVAITLMLLVHG